MVADPLTFSYPCEVVRVVDGDTLVLRLDLGLRLSATVPVRLSGIDTPELSTEAGKGVREWVKAWVASAGRLSVTTSKDPEKYGRWLGVVESEDGSSLADVLLSQGLGRRYDGGKR